jgi:hypothetical protein
VQECEHGDHFSDLKICSRTHSTLDHDHPL